MTDQERSSQKNGGNKKKNGCENLSGGAGKKKENQQNQQKNQQQQNKQQQQQKGQKGQQNEKNQSDNRSNSSASTVKAGGKKNAQPAPPAAQKPAQKPLKAPEQAKKKDKKEEKPVESSSATSSTTTAKNSSSGAKMNNSGQNPPMTVNFVSVDTRNNGMTQPLMRPLPLMGLNSNLPPRESRNFESTLEESMNVSRRQVTANKRQTQAYYFSEQAGTAVSATQFQEAVQYSFNSFPLDRNVDILIERKWNLLLTPTSGRCNALFIRVKSQNHDNTLNTGALLKQNASKKEIRAACEEAITNFNLALSKPESERFPYCVSAEPFLTENFIKRLDERQDAFPDAVYYCEKCDYHINTMGHARAHLESSTHFDDVERQDMRLKMLKSIGKPSETHLKAINLVLQKELKEYQEVKKEGEERAHRILLYLQTSLFNTLGYSEVVLKPFGSATYNVVLPDSDYNVAFTMDLPEGTPLFSFLEKIRSQLSTEGYKADHIMDMGTTSTIVFFFEGVRVRLCWMSSFNCRSQLYFTQLMQTYTGLRKEVVEFLQLIRIWAARAQVDSKNRMRIGLPRYGFDIMAIHFLQQAGYLPVLHELFETNGEKKEESCEDSGASGASEAEETPPEEARQRRLRLMSRYLRDLSKIREAFPELDRPWNMAELWIGFFRYFVQHNREIVVQITQKLPMTRDCHKWNKKILHVVDPFRSDNVLSIPKVSNWQPYYFNCLMATFISFAIPRNQNGPLVEWAMVQNKSSKKARKEELRAQGGSISIMPVIPPVIEPNENHREVVEIEIEIDEEEEMRKKIGEMRQRLTFDGIPLDQLKPENVEIDNHLEQIYSRRTMERVRRVHPFDDEEQMKIFEKVRVEYISNRKLEKKLFRKIRRKAEEDAEAEKLTTALNKVTLEETEAQSSTLAKVEEEEEKEKNEEKETSTGLDKIPQSNNIPYGKLPESTPSEDGTTPRKATFASTKTILTDTSKNSSKNEICLEEFFVQEKNAPADWKKKADSMKLEDYRFEFNHSAFSAGFEMEMKCTHCDGAHCVENCPMMEIPPIEKFPPRSPDELKDIDNIIDKFYDDNHLDPKRLRMVEKKVAELEDYLQKNYQPDVNLTIFGSIMTGLSVNQSDIDICLKFGPGDVPPKDLSPKDVIKKTENILRKSPLAKRITAIVTAKVPIVKFQLKLSYNDTVDVDVSYYNILALYNTRLLREYTIWTPDYRFTKLALFIKSWAKHCDIGDASRGSLSSYAHTILLISYLQQCDPPVLPRLQEDFRNGNEEQRIIENWDTYFVEATEQTKAKWQKNKESCAQLLLGYMDYYSKFDFRNFVVQCRREMTLCKMEKEWPKPLCVEDPFDLNHNLSSGLTKKMYVFILKVFIASRAVFMSVKPEVPRDSQFLDQFRYQLFHACSQGSAPNDRQCHQCHRVGHFYESCPMRYESGRARKSLPKQRHGSNSSYRSLGTTSTRDQNGEMDRLQYHKRPFNRRSNR